jgi:hypothetical protein
MQAEICRLSDMSMICGARLGVFPETTDPRGVQYVAEWLIIAALHKIHRGCQLQFRVPAT